MTITELQEQLQTQKTTSVELVKMYLNRIATYDESLNSLADLNHEALLEAEILDEARKNNRIRGLLHGIPIVVKDNILTSDTMRTTANSFAFKNFYAPFDATIIKKLKAAGAIILAKANCSEFAYFMSMGNMPSGFGSMFGQVKHPYDLSLDPLGSSTGSAVAVAANLAAASIGTETNGSLVSPAKQNNIVTIKPTLGLVSRHGIIPITRSQDTAGPMAKTVQDCAILLDIIKGSDPHDLSTKLIPKAMDFTKACDDNIKNRKVAVINFTNYKNSDEETNILQEAQTALEKQGATIIHIDYNYKLENNMHLLVPEFKRDINKFLSSLHPHIGFSSLKDIINFNLKHERRTLKYGQTILQASEASDERLKDSAYINAKQNTERDILAFLKLFDDKALDAIITTKVTSYPPIGGLPVVSVPAKPLNDKNPINLQFIGKKFTEEILIALASTYESFTKHRVEPNLEIHKKTKF